MDKKISVIIPARNEEKTIAQVIEKVRQNENVKQIIRKRKVGHCPTFYI